MRQPCVFTFSGDGGVRQQKFGTCWNQFVQLQQFCVNFLGWKFEVGCTLWVELSRNVIDRFGICGLMVWSVMKLHVLLSFINELPCICACCGRSNMLCKQKVNTNKQVTKCISFLEIKITQTKYFPYSNSALARRKYLKNNHLEVSYHLSIAWSLHRNVYPFAPYFLLLVQRNTCTVFHKLFFHRFIIFLEMW